MDNILLRFPDNYIGITRGYSASHKGIDLGWNTNYGGPNCSIYAPADGEVIAIENTAVNTYPTGIASWGNYVKIKHDDNVYTLMAHLQKGSITEANISVGSIIRQGQLIGRMNNSGYSNGSHLHYEVYIGGPDTIYRVDPLKYTYVFGGQIISPNTECKAQIQLLKNTLTSNSDNSYIKEAYSYLVKTTELLKLYI